MGAEYLAAIGIGLDPNLISAGGVVVTWHGLFTFLGVLVVILWALRQQRRYGQADGISEDAVYGTAIWAIIGGVVGARLVHVVDNLDYYLATPFVQLSFFGLAVPFPTFLMVWTGGIGLIGGIVGAAIAGSIYARRKGYPVGRMVDLLAPGIPLGQFVGRIGDIINGEHISAFTNVPWAFVYTHPGSPSYGLRPQHPAIAYEMIWDLVIFFVALKLIDRLRPNGMVFFSFLALYALGRFFIQFFRQDPLWFLGLQEAHILSLAILAVAVPVLAARAHFVRPGESVKAPRGRPLPKGR